MKKIFNLLLCLLLFAFTVSINSKISANEFEQDYKYYTTGIVDGGAYRIKNNETGLYMTVDNDENKIVLSNLLSNENQMFYVNYLGDNRYTFNLYNSKNVMFHMSIPVDGTDLTTKTINNSVTFQRFRIVAINSTEYNIYTNISSYNSALCAGYDSTNEWHVEQYSSSKLETSQMKWTFEKVDDRAMDKYTAYYLKDSLTNKYLTVSGTSNGAQLSLKNFIGDESQRFKKYFLNDGNGFGYYYVPMIKTDMAIELSTITMLDVFDKNSFQKFTETSNSFGYYKLSAVVDGTTKYISKGSSYTYDSDTAYYLTTTTSSSSAINFAFEIAYHETPFIYNLNLETSMGRTLKSYSEKHVYTIKPTISGDYNFFIKRTSGSPGLSVYDQNDLWMPGTVINYTNGQRYKVNLERDKIYYVIVADYNSIGSSYTFYCRKDLLVYIHGMNTSYVDGSDFNSRADAAIPSRDKLNSYDYYDPIINTEADMTSTFVKNVDPTTGIIPLQSPIYVVTGHGASNRVAYSTGTDSPSGNITRLFDSDLYNFSTNKVVFDMSNNLFSAWVACETAKGSNTITEAAQKAGSRCSLGFEDSIGAKASNRFIVNLFEEIENGYSISNAVDRAHSGISFWFSGLGSAKFYGDSSLVLKPTIPPIYSSMSTQMKNELMDTFNLLEYTFMYENNRGTLKRYVKIIGGYETDDYIDVYYEDNKIIGYYKSKQVYNNIDIDTTNFVESFKEEDNFKLSSKVVDNGILYDKIITTKTYEQLYTYNGSLIPVRFYVTTYINDDGQKYIDINVVNVEKKVQISEDIIYE